MTNIELYINNNLCDVANDFGVRITRVLLNPGELNSKDAQYSYSVSLPPTANNHAIFNYANIEETRGKFNRIYSAELIINSMRVFVGNFRLSEVTRTKYKGNLYVPATKSIKDIFGEMKLSENPAYTLPFTDFAASIGGYNLAARTTPQPAIFPYTLYGLLPKVQGPDGGYSGRDVWDETVTVGMADFAPSPNVLKLIRHLFETQGYNIGGTAFEDERLVKLYMSYKNDPQYTQPWNYGRQARIHITGLWSNIYNRRIADTERRYEHGVFTSSVDNTEVYACDLFDSTNAKINIVEDPGGNVTYSEVEGYARTLVHIPVSGYYKIQLKANTQLHSISGIQPPKVDGINRIFAVNNGGKLQAVRNSVKLLRDNKQGEFNISSSRMDGVWDYDNMPQTSDSDPRYVPYYHGGTVGSILLIDQAQNSNYVAGFQWGKKSDSDLNPSATVGDVRWAQIQVAKPAVSWDASRAGERLTRLAINNPVGYKKYGVPDESESDTPVWSDTDRYKIQLQNAPANESQRGYFEGVPGDDNLTAQGSVNCVVWLEAGELLTLADVSDKGSQQSIFNLTVRGWVAKSTTFDLTITPFRTDADWLKVNTAGDGTAAMNWNDDSNFAVNEIDLVKFLPADMKTDDFIDNFCKAFNLQLSQVDATTFTLDVKQTKAAAGADFINLDNLTSVRDRSNTPLGLPSLYKLGFTVDKEEEGYFMTKDEGGGEFATGATEEKVVEQKSTFSYNWFKNIQQGSVVMPLAIISKHDVWADPEEMLRSEAMLKRYTGQALRFWYYDGLLNDLGAVIEFNNQALSVAKVSNELPGLNTLNYKNQKLTILDNYFTVLVNADSHYTEIEGYLTPIQYAALSGSARAIFNGDIYRIAEISGYDPLGRNKTKVKLIPDA